MRDRCQRRRAETTLALCIGLSVPLLLASPAAAADAPAQADQSPDPAALVEREKTLRRVDTARVAGAELRAARGLFVLAGWLAADKQEARRRRALRLAALKLDLAERLVAVSQLKAEVQRLKRALTRTKRSIVKTRARIKQRGAYLDVLRRSR